MLIDRLFNKIANLGSPICVSLEPSEDIIPNSILKQNVNKFGYTYKALGASFYDYNKEVINSINDKIGVVSFPLPIYESIGSAGIEALRLSASYAKNRGFIIILDACYAGSQEYLDAFLDAYLGENTLFDDNKPIFDFDYITINPYGGEEVFKKLLLRVDDLDKGFFILVKSSISNDLQDTECENGKFYELVSDLIIKYNKSRAGVYSYGAFGAIVNTTNLLELRSRLEKALLLVRYENLNLIKPAFDSNKSGAIILTPSHELHVGLTSDTELRNTISSTLILKNKAISDILGL